MLLQINTITCDGSDVFWPWLLWLLGAFLLGIILGWLLKQLFSGNNKSNDNTVELARLKADLAECRLEKNKLSSSAVSKTTNVASASSGIVAAAKKEAVVEASPKKATAVAAAVASVKEDLTKVEGIGPKIKEHMNNAGIWSFKELSDSSLERLQKVLTDAGPRYKMHNPKTWAEQSKLAHEGKWEELKKFQDSLHGGL